MALCLCYETMAAAALPFSGCTVIGLMCLSSLQVECNSSLNLYCARGVGALWDLQWLNCRELFDGWDACTFLGC
jgi:hypothetical protein